MAKKRIVNTKFWDDNYIVKRDPIEKLLYLYLLTNPLTNILGVYEISIRRIAFDTGIDKDMVIKILERFKVDDKIKYYDGYIAIKKFTKYQANNPKINKGIELLLKETPEILIKWIDIDFNRLDIEEDSLYIGLDRTSKDSNYSNSNSNNNNNNNTNRDLIYIYSTWNSSNIIKHRNIEPMRSAITLALKKYDKEEIATSIKNYAYILNNDDYFFSYKFTLNKFLTITAKTNHIEEFLNLEVAKNNYKKWETKKPPSNRVNLSEERLKRYNEL